MSANNIFPFINASGDIPAELTPERLRQIMIKALDKVVAEMFPESQEKGFIDPKHFADVTFETDQGEKWRGMVYPVEPMR
jgi:hypothetical protein